MRISEKDFTILRYLSWHKTLLEHPDYQKAMRSNNPEKECRKGTPVIKNYIEDNCDLPNGGILGTVYRNLNLFWPIFSERYGYRVELLSKAFVNYVTEAGDAFEKNDDVCREYLANKEFKGTLLIPHLNSSLSYYIRFNTLGYIEQKNYLQLGDGDCIVLYADDYTAFTSKTIHVADIRNGKTVEINNMFEKTLDYIENLDNIVRDYVLFLKFANVTEKFILASNDRKAKKIIGEKEYINDTNISIRQMNATYYTTTTHVGGFPRKGFFRMQPHKVNGEWTHYLKWIDATMVSGYTRKAKILLNQ